MIFDKIPFDHELIRKYVIIFGKMFDDIHITDGSKEENIIKVPLSYGPREKYLARVKGNENDDRNIAITLPRISFDIANMTPSTTRRKTRNTKFMSLDKSQSVYSATPYDLDFEMSILVRNNNQGARIVEQILPYFNPDWVVTAFLLGENFPSLDIPIVLNSVAKEDIYDGDFLTRRSITWNLSFTMKAYFFAKISENKLIKKIDVNMFADIEKNKFIEGLEILPGLDKDGKPTEDESSSIDYKDINKKDNYAVITKIKENE